MRPKNFIKYFLFWAGWLGIVCGGTYLVRHGYHVNGMTVFETSYFVLGTFLLAVGT